MGGANIKSLQESSYPIPNWCATAIVFNAVRQFCFPKPNSARLGRYDTICSVVCQRHFRFGSKAALFPHLIFCLHRHPKRTLRLERLLVSLFGVLLSAFSDNPMVAQYKKRLSLIWAKPL